MTLPKGGNLEERVKRIKRKIAILDDNKADRHLIEINFKLWADSDNIELEFLSTDNPEEVVEEATKDTSIDVVIADFFLTRTPLEMKSQFENGLDALRGIDEVRGSSIHKIFMSGLDSIEDEVARSVIKSHFGEHYLESLSKTSFIDEKWPKSGHRENIRKLYDIVKNAVLKNNDPKYNRLHVLTGESGTGKSSAAWYLSKRVSNLEVVISDTTKEPRPSELLGPEVPILYQRRTHNYHPTHESLHDTIMKMSNPLIWTSTREVLAKETYERLYNALRKDGVLKGEIDFYAIDVGAIDKGLEEGDDVLVFTSFLDVVKYLRSRYGKRCLVTGFEADEFSRAEWMRREGRSLSEILERTELERMLRPEYRKISDMTIDTSYHSTSSDNPDYNRRRAIDKTASRESEIITFSREMPNGTKAKTMCIAYTSSIEEKLAALTKENMPELEKGQTIAFPTETMVSFNKERSSDDMGLIGLMAWLSQAEVADVERGKDGVYVHLIAKEVANVPEHVRNEEPWKNALKNVFSFYLSKEGYKVASTDTFHSKTYKGPEAVSLLYALDDYNYCIQLIFD